MRGGTKISAGGPAPKLISAAIMALSVAGHGAAAKGLTTLYTFSGGADGGNSLAGLLAGPGGSFFGTTTMNSGTVFQLKPPSAGGSAWTLTTLYTFSGGADGAFPQTLIMGSDGALYGMTDEGGTFNGVCAGGGPDIGCGTVFRLAPPASGQTAWQLTTLWSFSGSADGSSPTGGVVMGPAGELYGFTYGGFTCPSGVCGGVYRLNPPGSGRTAWTETTLYSFRGGRDGALAGSYGPPVLDKAGSIFGTTGSGGNVTDASCAPYGCGTVFQLSPGAYGQAWRKQTLAVFKGRNGIQPIGGLTQDSSGTLYGSTNEGGRFTDCMPGGGYPNGCGVAFAVVPPSGGATAWTEQPLRKFTGGKDGAYPFGAPLAVDGRVFATTSGNEPASFGSLSELLPPLDGKSLWRERAKFVFTDDADGGNPAGTPLWRNGALYGTTYGGGNGPAPYGTIYEFDPK